VQNVFIKLYKLIGAKFIFRKNLRRTFNKFIFKSVQQDQPDALFTFSLLQLIASTCFEQAYCSSSGGTVCTVIGMFCVEISKLFKITYVHCN
jgi:hypothetical protein